MARPLRGKPTPTVSHPLVVNVKAKGAQWDVYVGRNTCPCGMAGCEHMQGDWGNPFPLSKHGPRETMARFFDFVEGVLANNDPGFTARVRALAGKRLGCYCKGRYPVCHAEVLARLAEGERIKSIRADVMGRLPS